MDTETSEAEDEEPDEESIMQNQARRFAEQRDNHSQRPRLPLYLHVIYTYPRAGIQSSNSPLTIGQLNLSLTLGAL